MGMFENKAPQDQVKIEYKTEEVKKMGMFENKAPQDQVKIEYKTEEVKEVSEQTTATGNTRSITIAECLKDARQAYILAGEQPSSEDLRAMAITLFIDEGKNGRVADMRQNRGQNPSPRPATTGQKTSSPTGVKLPFFKFAEHENQDVVLTTISDDGEYQVQGRITHGFTIEVEGVQYKLTTTAKALLPNLVAGKTITVKMFKEAGSNGINYTKYEVK